LKKKSPLINSNKWNPLSNNSVTITNTDVEPQKIILNPASPTHSSIKPTNASPPPSTSPSSASVTEIHGNLHLKPSLPQILTYFLLVYAVSLELTTTVPFTPAMKIPFTLLMNTISSYYLSSSLLPMKLQTSSMTLKIKSVKLSTPLKIDSPSLLSTTSIKKPLSAEWKMNNADNTPKSFFNVIDKN
jgi:hypothetical protein